VIKNAAESEAQGHSEKPVDWQTDWVKAWCPPGGTVLDLYAGRGSVALAVLRAGGGRKYVGAEKHPGRHAAALRRAAELAAELAQRPRP
jgi:site-specific DNA-methyltransferase (adenine-specific)